jgi:exosortase/archaeosortase family protein
MARSRQTRRELVNSSAGIHTRDVDPGCEVIDLIRKIALFAVVFAALQLTWQASTPLGWPHAFVARIIVVPAAFAINLVTPGVHAHADGSRLLSPSGGLNIVSGCDGTEMLFLLAAAFVVAPLAWRARLGGMLAGLPVVYLLNQARILALFYSQLGTSALFDAVHGLVAPVATVVFIAAYYYVWLSRASRAASRVGA